MIWGTRPIKVVVCRQVALKPRNALWLLFSGKEKRVAFAMQHFGLNNHDMSTILSQISETYRIGGLKMPYTLEDFKRERLEESIEKIKDLPGDEQQKILAHLPAKIRLEGLDLKDHLANLDPKDRLAGLDPKDLLASLSQKELDELRKLINQENK